MYVDLISGDGVLRFSLKWFNFFDVEKETLLRLLLKRQNGVFCVFLSNHIAPEARRETLTDKTNRRDDIVSPYDLPSATTLL